MCEFDIGVCGTGGGGGTNDYLDYSITELKAIMAVQNASVKRYIFTGG